MKKYFSKYSLLDTFGLTRKKFRLQHLLLLEKLNPVTQRVAFCTQRIKRARSFDIQPSIT